MSKKEKKKKVDSLPKIRRRLLKLWSETIRERDGYMCCYCGVKHMSINPNNPTSKTKCDSHHLLQKEIKDCPLKFEIRNSALLCSSHHKWDGEFSAHKSPIVFYDWFRKKYPDRYNFVLENSTIRVDLDNRHVLAEIEKRLLAKESLDINKLKEIEKQFPREQKSKTPEIKGSLFDDEDESSSSS
jgi:hypothetical protein